MWHEQTSRYTSELRELKQQIVAQLEGLDKNKEALKSELDAVGVRVDRVEREMDYLETQNGAQPCVDVDDKLVEQQVIVAKERNKSKYAKLTGIGTMFHKLNSDFTLKYIQHEKVENGCILYVLGNP